jgi:hypothetical protein
VIESTVKEKLKCGRRKSEAAEEMGDRIWQNFTKSNREVAESYFTLNMKSPMGYFGISFFFIGRTFSKIGSTFWCYWP